MDPPARAIDVLLRMALANDRAAAILGGSYVESLLGRALAKVLRPHPGSQDELLEGGLAPLGSLHARILMCQRLGLIDDGLARVLQIIRRIRNDFAHELDDMTFESPGVRSRVRSLIELLPRLPQVQDASGQPPAVQFAIAVGLVAGVLEGILMNEVRVGVGHEQARRRRPASAHHHGQPRDDRQGTARWTTG